MHISMLWLGFSSGMMQDSNCCEEFSFANITIQVCKDLRGGLIYLLHLNFENSCLSFQGCLSVSLLAVKLMKWDEDIFGLEYGLAPFNIVVVPDFDMEPVEKKSSNIFNPKLVLASPQSAAVADYTAILGIIDPE